ncbi:MAG TPA: VTT domain-containing protein [Candidatus Saccharimonadales bacterium]|nr:VTT domain-containing protein [Candidatus Saccharimonadales bacterium]
MEELISPIPSFLVLIPAGAAAEARNAGIFYLLLLMVVSAFGRIIAALILYWVADKFEDKLLANGRRFFGVSHAEVERVGQKLGKKRKRDWIILFLMNAVPIFPTGALSVTCGFLKVRLKLFALCTFFGTMVNSLIYMLIGYAGFKAVGALKGLELASQIVLGVLLVVGAIWLVRIRRRRTRSV